MSKLEDALLGGTEGKEPTPKEWKLIGFYISPEMRSELTLLSIGLGLDKSKFLRMVITEFIRKNDPIKVASKKFNDILASSEEDPEEFRNKLQSFLRDKKVSDDLIERVLQLI